MPVEIKELIIRAVVNDSETPSKKVSQPSPQSNDRIIAECVRQTLKILKQKEER